MCTTPMAPSSIRWTPSAITGIYQGRGRCSFLINQKASRRRVWSASTTVYGRMCGLSWERKSRCPEQHSQGRDRVQRSKAVPGQRQRRHRLTRRHPQQHRSLSEDTPVCINPSGLRLRVRAYLDPSNMTLHPGNVQGYNNEIVIAGSEAAIGHNPGIGADRQDHRR